jgi:hypothetical protein
MMIEDEERRNWEDALTAQGEKVETEDCKRARERIGNREWER